MKKNSKKPWESNPSDKAQETVLSENEEMRLNKFIAHAGVCSRREADKLISDGQISVNGKVIMEMGFKVTSSDEITFKGKQLQSQKKVYILLNKPKDVITTASDPEGRRTVMDLVKTATTLRIYPVGRLDRNTTGLLLLTNDGDLAKKLTHPSYGVKKIYQVDLDKPISPEQVKEIRNGLTLEDGLIKVDEIAIVDDNPRVVGVELHSGRNRIVRRIFEHMGLQVEKLDRILFAGLTKWQLPRKKWRYLKQHEIVELKHLLQVSEQEENHDTN